jgi:hypothetical protein
MDRQERTADGTKLTTQAETQSGCLSLSGVGDADERARAAGIPGVGTFTGHGLPAPALVSTLSKKTLPGSQPPAFLRTGFVPLREACGYRRVPVNRMLATVK